MSKRFNPLSAGVAAVTATVILGVAGCAMGTRTASTTDQTDTAGLSRDSIDNSQAPVVAQADPSTMPSTTVAMDTPVAPAEPAPVAAPLANDTAVIPSADQAPIASTPAYPASTDMSASTNSTTATTTPSPDMSEPQPLPPRTDRN